MKKSLILSMLLFLMVGHLVFSQARTGVFTGRVEDEQGEYLPGVYVTIKSPALIQGSMGAVSNERGLYRFINLPPGVYALRAELQSFAPYEQTGIRVKLGLTSTVNIILKMGTISEEIEVVAESPVVDVESNKLSVNYDKEFLAKLPSKRNLVAIMNLTPGVIADTGLDPKNPDRSSFGSGSRENYFSMDGTYLTDPASGTPMIFWNYDIIEEAQVQGIGHPAEYGNSTGAVVNVVTKSGGENLSGLMNIYYRNKGMRSDNHEGTGLDAPSNAIKNEWEGSFNLGGPALREKVWFFVSGGLLPSDSETAGFPEDIQRRQRFFFGKVSSQFGPQHKLSLVYNYSYDRTNHMYASQFRTPESTLNSRQWTSTVNLQWNYYISSDVLLELRGAYIDRATSYVSNGPGASYYDLISGMETKSGGFNNEQDRARYQLQGSLSAWVEGFGGDHDIKTGFEFEQGESGYEGTMQSDYPGGPTYYYTIGGELFMYVVYDPATIRYKNIFRTFSGYVQDTWKIGSKLTLNIGARLSNIRNLVPVQENVTQEIEEYEFTNIEPRLGFVYDLSAGGRQMAIKGYYGRNYVNSVAYGLLNPIGRTISSYLVFGNMSFLNARTSPAQVTIDPDLGRPYADTFVAGFEMSLMKDLAFRLNGVYKKSKNFIAPIDRNITPDSFVPVDVSNPITGGTLTVYNKVDFQDTFKHYTNPEEADRSYKAVQFILEKPFSNNYQFIFSYTYSRTEGMIGLSIWSRGGLTSTWNNPNLFINARGVLDLDKPHVIKFSGIYQAPLGIILGLSYTGQSGYPYQRGFRVRLNQGYVALPAEEPGAQRTPFQHMIDVRIEKTFTVGSVRPRIFFEAFNLLNSNTTLSTGAILGSASYGEITSILPPRILRLGVGLEF